MEMVSVPAPVLFLPAATHFPSPHFHSPHFPSEDRIDPLSLVEERVVGFRAGHRLSLADWPFLAVAQDQPPGPPAFFFDLVSLLPFFFAFFQSVLQVAAVTKIWST